MGECVSQSAQAHGRGLRILSYAEWGHPIGQKVDHLKFPGRRQTLNPSMTEVWEHTRPPSQTKDSSQSKTPDFYKRGKDMVLQN